MLQLPQGQQSKAGIQSGSPQKLASTGRKQQINLPSVSTQHSGNPLAQGKKQGQQQVQRQQVQQGGGVFPPIKKPIGGLQKTINPKDDPFQCKFYQNSSVRDWHAYVQNRPDIFNAYDVTSCSKIKNLNSSWKHEFLSCVVVRTADGEEMKMFVERESEGDRVIVGVDRMPEVFPLVLETLKFGKTAPTVALFSEYAMKASLLGGSYSVWSRNCYWFCRVIVDKLKKDFEDAKLDIWKAGQAGSWIIPTLGTAISKV